MARCIRRRMVGFVWCVAAGLLTTGNLDAQELQVVPSTHTDRAPRTFMDACLNVDRWPTVFGRTTYLGAVSWQLRPDRASDRALASCFSRMNANGLSLSLEVGITSSFAT